MKKNRLALAVLVLTNGLIVPVAFSSKIARNSFVTSKYYYICETPYQRLQTGHNTEPGLPERTIRESYFKNALNWTTESQAIIPITDNSKYIAYIEFTLDDTADGDDDGALTLSEALNAVWTKIMSTNYALPASFLVNGNSNDLGADIYVFFAAIACQFS